MKLKFHSIRGRMLAVLLPVILLANAALTFVSITYSDKQVNKQIGETMEQTLEAEEHKIVQYFNSVSTSASMMASIVGSSYKSMPIQVYEGFLKGLVEKNDMILGSGVWFAPDVFNGEKYMAPYATKTENGTEITYEYSNAEYDYFKQDYYKQAEAAKSTILTDPYYDEVSGNVMATCASPIIVGDQYLGCTTVDVSLNVIKDIISDFTIGETGTAVLLDSKGAYMAGTSDDKLNEQTFMENEENESLAALGKAVMENESGESSYEDDDTEYNTYYGTIDQTGWHLIIRMEKDELFDPIRSLSIVLTITGILAIVLCVIVIIWQVSKMQKAIKRVQTFALALSEGDFTSDSLEVKTVDEIGQMSDAMNTMYKNNKGIILNMSQNADKLKETGMRLKDTSVDLENEFSTVQMYMNQINEAMMNASSATEEVNASTEEVNASVAILSSETNESMEMVNAIRERAAEIGASSKENFNSATELSAQFEQRLHISMENSKVVESIGDLAEVISNIASEINLLSLNASIEAAHAGDQGKGFAVVATEIGKLAQETATAVGKIQNTINDVQTAFKELTDDAGGMLDFVQNTVTPDYNHFVDIANQYKEDAEAIASFSSKISQMADTINQVMNEVTSAIQSIAESAQDTADTSASIMTSMEGAAGTVENVSKTSNDQMVVANELTGLVDKFKL